MKFVQIQRRFEVFEREGGGGGGPPAARTYYCDGDYDEFIQAQARTQEFFPSPLRLICRLSCPSTRPSLPPIPNTSTDLNHHEICRHLAIEVTLLVYQRSAFYPSQKPICNMQYGDEL